MRIRYFSFLSLAIAAGFLVVVSQAFTAVDIANLALGVGIGMLVVAFGAAVRFRRHVPSLLCGVAAAAISAWMIVASQVFSLGTVQNLTFADALGVLGASLLALIAHELTTERVVHSLAPHRAARADYDLPDEHQSSRLREPSAA
ncbi:MAG TPA: hypothetical protein VL979_05955 [Solirubrobacteraceae bacterium]|nr:hypothetical protein [Solirubrobacteraceae bacterium]